MKYKIKTPMVLDVSTWQGKVNWPQLSPRPVLVLCKASEGVNFLDPTFPDNWSALKALNIRRGAYHYFHPELDVAKQFETYQKVVTRAGGFAGGDLPPVLDIEGMDGLPLRVRQTAATAIKSWLDKAEALYGRRPMIYTSKYEWSLLGGAPAWSGAYPLWVAWYPYEADRFGEPAPTVIPDGWKQWAIWQYAKNGKLSGLQAQVDLNILSEWFAKQLDQPSTQTTPGEPPPSRHVYQGTIIAPRGVNVRQKPDVGAKLVGSLPAGTVVRGESIKVVSPREAWLEVRDPLAGWCAIVYDGTTLISVNQA
jgi:lysozyme